MDKAVTRAAGATPSTKPPVGAMGRSWAILLTSPNHGIVRPLGHLFKDASDHHERVVVVEVPAGAGAPSDEVNLVLRAAPEDFALAIEREVAAQAGQVAVPEGWKLVPVEPTDSMIYAYERDAASGRIDVQGYRAMLAAAPSAPGGENARD